LDFPVALATAHETEHQVLKQEWQKAVVAVEAGATTTREATRIFCALRPHSSDVVGREDGAIPRKYHELIALGVAFTTQSSDSDPEQSSFLF